VDVGGSSTNRSGPLEVEVVNVGGGWTAGALKVRKSGISHASGPHGLLGRGGTTTGRPDDVIPQSGLTDGVVGLLVPMTVCQDALSRRGGRSPLSRRVGAAMGPLLTTTLSWTAGFLGVDNAVIERRGA
jgi:hypothetical protein